MLIDVNYFDKRPVCCVRTSSIDTDLWIGKVGWYQYRVCKWWRWDINMGSDFISSWGARTLRQANSGLVTANVYVCTYVGGGSVVGGRASSAAANSWESHQSTPVSLGRDQRDHLVTPLLLYRFLLFFVVYLWLLRNQSALLRVLSSQSSWYLDAVQ